MINNVIESNDYDLCEYCNLPWQYHQWDCATSVVYFNGDKMQLANEECEYRKTQTPHCHQHQVKSKFVPMVIRR